MSSSPKSIAKAKAIAILPKCTAFFSVLGSGFIIYDIVCSHFNVPPAWWRKKKSTEFSSSDGFSRRPVSSSNSNRYKSSRRFAQRKTLKNSAYYRLMLAMSCSDFVVSFAWFCTTWPIPRDELVLDNPSEKVYGNIGTPNTCTAQAFFIQLGIVTPFYNALLALYYYLTIRREWKEEDFKTKIETAGHMVSLAWGLGTSIAGLIMNSYNNSNVWCWINAYPAGCGDGDGQDQCIRGQNAQSLRWIFYYGPLWVMIFLVALFMSLVYIYVRGLDNKMDQYTRTYRQNAANAVRASADSGSSEFHSGGSDRRRSLMARTFSTMNADTINEQRRQRRNERSKAVANQGLFYAGTFALVWVFGTIVRAMQLAGATPPWTIIFLFAVFTPSQGFFNFLVYVRPRIIKHFAQKKKQREGKRNSKTGSSFNSDILHVSGISGASSSIEATGENQELSDPFTLNTKPDLDPPKVRFTTAEMDVDKGDTEESRNQSKVRFDSSRVRFNSTQVFISDDEDLDKGTKRNDSDPANPKIGITTVDVTLNIGEKDVPPEAAFNDIDDEKESEGTIDPALLLSVVSDDEVEKVESLTTKGNRDELVQLHNATIDFATGEVRTRTAVRRVSPS